MLHIIGLILKFIGMLLLVILGIIVLLLCAVLFVPIKYEIKADFPGPIEELDVRAKVTWFLHLIRADVAWKDGKLGWKVRAAWKVFDVNEEKSEEKKSEKKLEKKSEKVVPDKKEIVMSEQGKPNELPSNKEEIISDKKISVNKKMSEQKDQKKESILEKLQKKIEEIWKKIKYTFQNIYGKIKEGMALKDKIVQFVENESHKAALTKIKKELIWLKRFLKIKKGNINLRFGFEDPALTGKVLAILSMVYPFIEGNMSVVPEFEEQCFEGQGYLKGHLRVMYIAMFAVILVLDANIRKTYQDIKAWNEL